MLLLKTALQSLIGNGLKTWLTVFVLSLAIVMIIIMQGILHGWSRQAIDDAQRWELAGGQYWCEGYDPWDPFSLDSAVSVVPPMLLKQVATRLLEPVLITQATVYPEGHMQGVMLRGIRPDQQLLEIPTAVLRGDSMGPVPVVVGAFMARQLNVKLNDEMILRWRDKNGAFEAVDIRIAGVFKTAVPSIDNGVLWIALDRLQQMTMRENEANILVKSGEAEVVDVEGWEFKTIEQLMEATLLLVKTKSAGTSVFYVIFLLLAMLAIFDTQTLAIFRRQREIGTMVALGMTRGQVVMHFTIEGSLYALLAIVVGAVWGTPLIWYLSEVGISFPMEAAEFGVPMADVMYASVTPGLVLGTLLFVFVVTALVSYLPARKIATMNPTEAIRGKIL
jgi:ABC-type lipoprotein release transport system permease subunit